MVKNNHCELDKCTLVGWVDKVSEHALTKKNINNKFKITIIWSFIPKTMDDKTKPSVIYTTKPNPNFSNDDITNFDNVIYENQWGENETTTQLLNITRKYVRTKPDGRENLDVRYYVDISTNVNDSFKASLSKDVHGLPINLAKPTCEMQQARNSSTTMQDAPSFVNLHNVLALVNFVVPITLACKKNKGKITIS
jgi:hypothetical protein